MQTYDPTEQQRYDEWQAILKADPGYADFLESLTNMAHSDSEYLWFVQSLSGEMGNDGQRT